MVENYELKNGILFPTEKKKEKEKNTLTTLTNRLYVILANQFNII